MITATILMLGFTLASILIMEFQFNWQKFRTADYLKGYKVTEYGVFYVRDDINVVKLDSVLGEAYLWLSTLENDPIVYLGKL